MGMAAGFKDMKHVVVVDVDDVEVVGRFLEVGTNPMTLWKENAQTIRQIILGSSILEDICVMFGSGQGYRRRKLCCEVEAKIHL